MLESDSERPNKDHLNGVLIATGSLRRPLRKVAGQNNSGTLAPINRVTEAPSTCGKAKLHKCGISFNLHLAGIKFGRTGISSTENTLDMSTT